MDDEVWTMAYVIGHEEIDDDKYVGIIEFRVDDKSTRRWITVATFETDEEAVEAAKEYFSSLDQELQNRLTEQLVYEGGKLVKPHKLVFKKEEL